MVGGFGEEGQFEEALKGFTELQRFRFVLEGQKVGHHPAAADSS